MTIADTATGAEVHRPFGGVKDHGNGTRASGREVLEAWPTRTATLSTTTARTGFAVAQMATSYAAPDAAVEAAGSS